MVIFRDLGRKFCLRFAVAYIEMAKIEKMLPWTNIEFCLRNFLSIKKKARKQYSRGGYFRHENRLNARIVHSCEVHLSAEKYHWLHKSYENFAKSDNIPILCAHATCMHACIRSFQQIQD